MELTKYNTTHKNIWNEFVKNAKNATFLFNRNFMEYHADRFEDHSLLIENKGKLIAIFPCNRKRVVIESHGGLTYGGLILSNKSTVEEVIEIFNLVNRYFQGLGIKRVIYKTIPFIYNKYPAQEDLYALFRLNAKLIGRNISSTIEIPNKIKFSQSRKGGINKAKKIGLKIKQSTDYSGFWSILESNLKNKYTQKPVHSIDEIQILQQKFPDNIKLFEVLNANDSLLAGSVVFENNHTVHTQYISSTMEGRNFGALDFLFDHLINIYYSDKKYFDFGQSTEKQGTVLNTSLIFQKEGFGGRGISYDIYEYMTKNIIKI